MENKSNEWSEKFYQLIDRTLPYYCVRRDMIPISIDIGYLTDKNIGGFGKGIRGNYWGADDVGLNSFEKSLSPKDTDCLKRNLFKLGEEEELCKFLGDSYEKDIKYWGIYGFLLRMIENERKSYVSASPKVERDNFVYVELEDLEDYYLDNNNNIWFRLQNLLQKQYKEVKLLCNDKASYEELLKVIK